MDSDCVVGLIPCKGHVQRRSAGTKSPGPQLEAADTETLSGTDDVQPLRAADALIRNSRSSMRASPPQLGSDDIRGKGNPEHGVLGVASTRVSPQMCHRLLIGP